MPQSFWDSLTYTKVCLKTFYFPFLGLFTLVMLGFSWSILVEFSEKFIIIFFFQRKWKWKLLKRKWTLKVNIYKRRKFKCHPNKTVYNKGLSVVVLKSLTATYTLLLYHLIRFCWRKHQQKRLCRVEDTSCRITWCKN